MGVAKQGTCHDIGQDKGHNTGEQTEEKELPGVALHTLQVHLETGKEHDVVEAHAAEDLKGDVAFKDIESILADDDTCQYHADDVRNTQLAHHNRCRKNNQQYHEEDHRGVGNREVCCHQSHFVCKGTNKRAKIQNILVFSSVRTIGEAKETIFFVWMTWITRIFCNFAAKFRTY